MMKKFLVFIEAILVTGWLLCFNTAFAQHRILLLKRNKAVYSFHEADYIRFKRTDRDYFNTGFIHGIYPDAFRLGNDTTRVEWIEKVDLTGLPHTGFKTAETGRVLLVAGVIFMTADAVNTMVVMDQPYTLHRGVLASSVLLSVTGLAMQWVNNNYFVTGLKKKIIITPW